MELLPLTPGLLMSAAMRADHSIAMPRDLREANPLSRGGDPEKTFEYVFDIYQKAKEMTPEEVEQQFVTFRQVTEEFTGKGFYDPEKEKGYDRDGGQYQEIISKLLRRADPDKVVL